MAQVSLTWPEFKAECIRRGSAIQMVERSEYYYLFVFDGSLELTCTIAKADPPHVDQSEFEATFKVETNKTPIQEKPFADALGFRARLSGITGIALKGVETKIDFKLTDERWLNGGAVLVQNQGPADNMDFSVVDVDNIMGYGAGFTLDRFVSRWNISADKEAQGSYMIPYPARIAAGLYIRVTYRSSQTETDTQVKINLFLHKKT